MWANRDIGLLQLLQPGTHSTGQVRHLSASWCRIARPVLFLKMDEI
jgi:hypothetical protein